MKTRKITRRGFIAGSASALAFPTIIPASVLGQNGNVSPSNRITMGFIGTGSHGVAMNLKSFLPNIDANVIAVCDVEKSRMEDARDIVNRQYGNNDCQCHDDFREIIARDDIDAVCISTPDHWHVPISIMALKAGKDVISEKPTLTIAEGRELINTVARYGRVFQWATEDRAVYEYHRMCELVRNGRIGKLHTIHVELPTGPGGNGNPEPQPIPEGFNYEMWLGPAPYAPYTKDRCHYNFRWIHDYSGGMMTDWGAHLLDGAQWGSNTEHTGPVEVYGEGKFCEGGLYNTARDFHVEYTYADSLKLIVTSGTPSLKFEGSGGWIGNRGWRAPLKAEPASILDSVIGPNETHLYTCRTGEQRNFLDCVKSRRECYFPPEKGQRCFTIAHIGNISMQLRRKLKWNPEKEEFVDDMQANRMLARSMRGPWHL